MAIQLKHYVELRGDSPLNAVITGHHHKAYLVANLANLDSPNGSAKHYNLTLAEVYGAMAFYQENIGAIEEAIADARKLGYELGAKNIS